MTDPAMQFQAEMFEIYASAKRECAYTARNFLNMLNDLGGVAAAKRLLAGDKPQYGFTELWHCGCLSLTVECLVLRSRYRALFADEELDEARQRLRAHGYNPATCEN